MAQPETEWNLGTKSVAPRATASGAPRTAASVAPRAAAAERSKPLRPANDDVAWRAESVRERHAENLSRSRVVWAIVAAGASLGMLINAAARGAYEVTIARFVPPRIALVAALLAAVLRAGRAPTITPMELSSLDSIVYAVVAGALAFVAVETNSLDGGVLHVVAWVIVAQGVAVQDDWRRDAVRLFASASVFVAGVVLARAIYGGPGHSLLGRGTDLTTLASDLSAMGVLAAIVLGAVHVTNVARRDQTAARIDGRYILKKRIGRGGMGEVWLARSVSLDRDVALKLLRSDITTPQAIARLGRELAALAALRHPNTVRILDWGATRGSLYYVMEMLEGETLRDHVKSRGPIPYQRAVVIARQAARALAEAHDHGIVHRDIKPDNLFLSSREPDFVTVLDFGVAKPMQRSEGESSITEIGLVVGTASYMAPEQALSMPVDGRTDIYALGAVLFFMLTGRPPFTGSEIQVLQSHLREPVPSLEGLSPSPIPPALESVVRRCLQKSPALRYPNAASLDAALRNALEMPALEDTPTPMVRRRTVPPAPGRPAEAESYFAAILEQQALTSSANEATVPRAGSARRHHEEVTAGARRARTPR